jgi:hypothetical protein
MCYPVQCPKCGKTGWGGCGQHVDSVMRSVPPSQRCTCATQSVGTRQASPARSLPIDASGYLSRTSDLHRDWRSRAAFR